MTLRLPGTGSTRPVSNTLLLSLEHLFPGELGPVPHTGFDLGQSSAPAEALAPDSKHCVSQCRSFGLEFVPQTPHLPRALATWIYLSAYIMIQIGDRGLEHRDRRREERRRCPCPTAHSNPPSQPAEDSPRPETACKMPCAHCHHTPCPTDALESCCGCKLLLQPRTSSLQNRRLYHHK